MVEVELVEGNDMEVRFDSISMFRNAFGWGDKTRNVNIFFFLEVTTNIQDNANSSSNFRKKVM